MGRNIATAHQAQVVERRVASSRLGLSVSAGAPPRRVQEARALPVVALLLDRMVRARVTTAAGAGASVQFCERAQELSAYMAAGAASLVIAECQDRDGTSTLPVMAALRSGFPSVPLIAYVIPGRTPSSDMLAAARLGVHELVMQGFDDVGIALRAAMEGAVRGCAAARVIERLRHHVPDEVQPFLRYCLQEAFTPSVEQAAAYLGVHRKTLDYRLRQASLPPPRALLSWCRLFIAAHLLESLGASVADVALRLDFASVSALRGMLRRHTGLRPQDLRANGGLEHLLDLFMQRFPRR